MSTRDAMGGWLAMVAMMARDPRRALTRLQRGDAEGSSSIIRTAAAVGLALLVLAAIVGALVTIVNNTSSRISSAVFP